MLRTAISQQRARLFYTPRTLGAVARFASQATKTDTAEATLAGTTAFHLRHALLCTGTFEWPSHPEMFWKETFFGRLAQVKKDLIGSGPPILISLTDAPSKGPEGTHDILLFPEGIRLQGLRDEDVPAFKRLVETGERVPPATVRLRAIPLTGHHIFICTHGERDCRCGERGGRLYDTLKDATHGPAFKDVHVHRVSHIGGHKYAANAVVYPSGHWYGGLSEQDVPELIETARSGQGMWTKWRGRVGLDKKEQIQYLRKVNQA